MGIISKITKSANVITKSIKSKIIKSKIILSKGIKNKSLKSKSLISKSRRRSPWVVHFNCNSCNGCDIETLACLTPMYDVERFGIVNVGNPKHADILVVTGSVNHRNARVLQNIYEQIPEPKAVVAVGACACSGGIFEECYNVLGGIDRVIPVDVYVPGCSPRPEAIIDGIIMAVDKMDSDLEIPDGGSI